MFNSQHCDAFLFVFHFFYFSLDLSLHTRSQIIRIEVSKVLILRLPVEQDVALVSLVANAEENKQFQEEDPHVQRKRQKD